MLFDYIQVKNKVIHLIKEQFKANFSPEKIK